MLLRSETITWASQLQIDCPPTAKPFFEFVSSSWKSALNCWKWRQTNRSNDSPNHWSTLLDRPSYDRLLVLHTSTRSLKDWEADCLMIWSVSYIPNSFLVPFRCFHFLHLYPHYFPILSVYCPKKAQLGDLQSPGAWRQLRVLFPKLGVSSSLC